MGPTIQYFPKVEFSKEIIKPNRVFNDIHSLTERRFQSYKGLLIKIASEKLLFLLLSHKTILTSNASDKTWVAEFKKR